LEFEIAGRSAAWLARLPWEQEVGRSNRLAPTNYFFKNNSTIDLTAELLRGAVLSIPAFEYFPKRIIFLA
jgi:hypothetical protein